MRMSPVHPVRPTRRTSTQSTGLEHPPLTYSETVVQDTVAMIALCVEGRGEALGEEVLEQIFPQSGSSLEPSFDLGRSPCHLCSPRVGPVVAGPLRRPVCNRPLARDGPKGRSSLFHRCRALESACDRLARRKDGSLTADRNDCPRSHMDLHSRATIA